MQNGHAIIAMMAAGSCVIIFYKAARGSRRQFYLFSIWKIMLDSSEIMPDFVKLCLA